MPAYGNTKLLSKTEDLGQYIKWHINEMILYYCYCDELHAFLLARFILSFTVIVHVDGLS
mgnify:FL=1